MLGHLIRSKGPSGILHSSRALLGIFGLTAGPMTRALMGFSEMVRRHRARATFPITASVLDRHAGLLRSVIGDAIELAVHGYRHLDHSLWPEEQQSAEVARARQAFRRHGLRPGGFRAPYLRWNRALLAALSAAGFTYDSSDSLLWPVVDSGDLEPSRRAALQTLLDFCRPRAAERAPSLPYWVDGLTPGDPGPDDIPLLEIPVSFPDDEMLVERLRWRDPGRIAAVWLAVAEMSHARGELFVLQLHPGRFPLCGGALERVLTWAAGQRPCVWIASLGEVADWWREKRTAQVKITPVEANEWQVTVEAPSRAVLLVRGEGTEALGAAWGAGYRRVPGRSCRLRAPRRPWVGLGPGAPTALAAFLRDQGYLVETSEQAGECAIYLPWTPEKGFDPTAPDQAAAVLQQVESAPGPLIRLGRWPDGAQSALAISGDIDALTIWDYSLRFIGR